MEVVMIEDRPRQASEFASRAGRLLVKLERLVQLKFYNNFKVIATSKRYEEAINMLSKEMNYHIAGENPAAVGRVLIAVVMVNMCTRFRLLTKCYTSQLYSFI